MEKYLTFEEREKIIRKEWFPKHEVRWYRYQNHNIYTDDKKRPPDDIMFYHWRNPKHPMTYLVNYCFVRNILFVSGDIGEATYKFSDFVTMNGVANCNVDYFSSKCTSSEYGREYKQWDTPSAVKWFKEFMKREDIVDREEIQEFLKEGLEIMEGEYYGSEWKEFILNHAYGVLDSEDSSYLSDIGMRVSWRCQGHLVGLKMINEQLNKKN